MVSRTQSFTYDPDAARASTTHSTPGGASYTTTFGHNDAAQPTSMTDWRNKVSTTAYLPSGAPQSRTLGSGVATAGFEWHADGMPEAMTWRNEAEAVVRSHVGIGYDGGGRRTSEYVTARQPGGLTSAGTARYAYDLADRLVSWTSPFADPGAGEALSVAYDLDDGSNIVGATTTGATSETVVATIAAAYPNGRLESRTTTAGGTCATEAFTYDGLGQETLRQGEDIDTASAYDPRGHTTEVDDRTGEDDDVTSVYDGADRLISRTEPGAGPDRAETILYFYWGGGASLAEETDGAGNTLVRYACDTSGNALAQQSYRVVNGAADPTDTEGTWRWLLVDVDANVATQLNDDGTVAEQSAFDPYGQPQAGGSSVTDPKQRGSTLGFQGAITDRASGSVVLGPRLYDPSTARFSTADSFVAGGLDLGLALDPLTGNRYLFAGANPVGYFDDGHAPYVRAPYGHPVGEREPALELLRQVRERQRRSEPMSLAVARRPPTKDGFCFLGRRGDGRCRGASTFTDFAVGSDSEKAAIDSDYNNPFLNANPGFLV
jgi:RHS repeat-associated protein